MHFKYHLLNSSEKKLKSLIVILKVKLCPCKHYLQYK